MNLINLTCNNCGADIDIDIDRLQGFCPYCGQKLLFDLDHLDKILAEKERTKQVQLQEETKRMQAAEPRMRMKAQHDYKIEKEKGDIKKAIIVLAVLILLFAGYLFFIQVDKKHQEKAGLIITPKKAEDLIGLNYEDVEQMFLKAGFTNIELKPQYDLSQNVSIENGKVVSVSINGETDFYADWYEPDATVWIRYHAIENE